MKLVAYLKFSYDFSVCFSSMQNYYQSSIRLWMFYNQGMIIIKANIVLPIFLDSAHGDVRFIF
jgi:hypothetical protein